MNWVVKAPPFRRGEVQFKQFLYLDVFRSMTLSLKMYVVYRVLTRNQHSVNYSLLIAMILLYSQESIYKGCNFGKKKV